MNRKLLLASLPFFILGTAFALQGLLAPPLIPIVSSEQRSIKGSSVPNYYYYLDWPLELSSGQKAEFQFSASQPISFYIMDKKTFDQYIQNQTVTPTIISSDESENTHSFTPTQTDTYYFIIQNVSSQEATVSVTIRESFNDLAYVGIGVLAIGSVLAIVGFAFGPKAVDPRKVLDLVRLRGQIWIGDLATMLSTSRTDIELAIVKLRKRGEPVVFDVLTGNVSYGWPPPPSGTVPGTFPPVQPESRPSA